MGWEVDSDAEVGPEREDPGVADRVFAFSDVDAECVESLGSVLAGLGTCFAGSGDSGVLLCELGFWASSSLWKVASVEREPAPVGMRPVRVRERRRWPSLWGTGRPRGSQK